MVVSAGKTACSASEQGHIRNLPDQHPHIHLAIYLATVHRASCHRGQENVQSHEQNKRLSRYSEWPGRGLSEPLPPEAQTCVSGAGLANIRVSFAGFLRCPDECHTNIVAAQSSIHQVTQQIGSASHSVPPGIADQPCDCTLPFGNTAVVICDSSCEAHL